MQDLFFSRKYLRRKIIFITPIITAILHFYWRKKQESKPAYCFVETPTTNHHRTPWTWNPTPKHDSPLLEIKKCDRSQIRLNTSDFRPFVEYHRGRSNKVYVPKVSEEHKLFMANEYKTLIETLARKLNETYESAVPWWNFLKWIYKMYNWCRKTYNIADDFIRNSVLTKIKNLFGYVSCA
ncbi:uncharacterized protein VNE69_02144 [Vairimorpha necatrix]|uniref:Uncharacterized protein n=1 Tax=Vairimorpha necatrix TaxID=6039 RepID=A0AAX4J9L1_9MICR